MIPIQKTVIVLGRIVFTGTMLVLMLTLFIGVVLTINFRQNNDSMVSKNLGKDSIVLASQNDTILGTGGKEITDKVVMDDARPLLLKRYLEKYKSPLAPYSDLIIRLSKTYGYEYYWIVAIAQQESNLCKKIPDNSFNCWGYGIHKSGTLRFDNYELAIQSYAEYLKREYFDKGLNTPELIMKKYCPSSNGSWAYGVSQFIQEIETGN